MSIPCPLGFLYRCHCFAIRVAPSRTHGSDEEGEDKRRQAGTIQILSSTSGKAGRRILRLESTAHLPVSSSPLLTSPPLPFLSRRLATPHRARSTSALCRVRPGAARRRQRRGRRADLEVLHEFEPDVLEAREARRRAQVLEDFAHLRACADLVLQVAAAASALCAKSGLSGLGDRKGPRRTHLSRRKATSTRRISSNRLEKEPKTSYTICTSPTGRQRSGSVRSKPKRQM